MGDEVTQYVPCLRWKQGEYSAVSKLSLGARNTIKPIIEVPEIGYDFESKTESKTIDEHLAKFAGRIQVNWGYNPCFVDAHLIDSSVRMKTGEHPLSYIFGGLRFKRVSAIPIAYLEQDSDCLNAIRETITHDRRGVCFRISIEEASRVNLANSFNHLLREYDVGTPDCDLILDLGYPNYIPIDGFVKLLERIISRLPYLNEWRSLILIGTSFPKSMGAPIPPGASTMPRHEWLLYMALARSLRDARVRLPVFGDYGINHPEVIRMDPRHLKPYATIRYTLDNDYLIVKGQNVRDYGYGQYRELCRELSGSKFYCGDDFSEGDRYISNCALGLVSTGGLTTWRWVGTNHHLEKVALDTANLSCS